MNTLKTYYKQIGIALGVVIIFLMVQRCNNDKYNRLVGEKEQIEKNLKTAQEETKEFERQRLAFKVLAEKELEKKQKEIDSSKKVIAQRNSRIANLQKQLKRKQQEVVNMNYSQVAKAINEVYNTDNATATDTSVNLSEDLPNKVLSTIYEAEICEQTTVEKDGIIEQQSDIIKDQDDSIVILKTLNQQAEEQINLEKKEKGILGDLNQNLEKQNRRLKVKNTLKSIAIPVAIIGGVILGSQIN